MRPVRSVSGESKLPFRIEGKIDIAAIRSNSCRRAALAAMRSNASVSDMPAADGRSSLLFVIGSVPMQTTTGASKLPFRIQGTINIKKVRSEAQRKAALKQWQAEMDVSEKRSLADEAVAV
jgi:hypothetical protein